MIKITTSYASGLLVRNKLLMLYLIGMLPFILIYLPYLKLMFTLGTEGFKLLVHELCYESYILSTYGHGIAITLPY